jgi:hypothetical protein
MVKNRIAVGQVLTLIFIPDRVRYLRTLRKMDFLIHRFRRIIAFDNIDRLR